MEESAEDAKAFAGTPAATFDVASDRDFRYCSEVLVRGERLPSSAEARTRLHELNGGSLQVLRTADLLRVHIHLNDPAPLFALGEGWGEVVTRKAEDMREQHQMLTVARRAVSVLSDSSCDLPDDVLDRHGIHMVPLQVIIGDQVYEDRVGIKPDAIYRDLRAGRTMTTSQPQTAAFTAAYRGGAALGRPVGHLR